MNRALFLLVLLTSLLLTNHSYSQGRLGVFIGGGTMWYAGDLQENAWPHAKTIRWTANAGLHWQITRRWGLQLNYTVGELIASDQFALSPGKRKRDFRFQTFIHEIGLRGTFDILPNDRWRVLPYITAGVAALNFEPKRDGVPLRQFATEGKSYSNWTLSIPTGLGVKWQINCRWALKGELLYHWTITDHLDDVSGAYTADTGNHDRDFYSDPGGVSPPREMRGNPKWKDGMFDINVGVIFFFTGCGRGKKGGLIEDCEQLYKDVDMEKLMDQYKQ
ncbi:MAG: porin family protein [Flavobacteriales bacterium]|nr:porin family protein [Flavobacteriales bacterium]